MGIWSDIAVWRGPTVNKGGSMVAQNGLVLHIAEGSYEGTISWQLNPVSQISSHFVAGLNGELAQIVDTDTTAWTQGNGNGRWLSIENAGFSSGQFTAGQIEACAQVFARGHLEYGYPLQITNDPNGQGLGWHGMGGAAWGGHYGCPGDKNVALRPAILARAIEIAGGGPTPPPENEDDDMKLLAPLSGYGANTIVLQYPTSLGLALQTLPGAILGEAVSIYGQEKYVADSTPYGTPIEVLREQWKAMGGAPGDLTAQEIADAVVDEEASRLSNG
jgi:N-acetylmuramoyl-L-alanine amidase-like protein